MSWQQLLRRGHRAVAGAAAGCRKPRIGEPAARRAWGFYASAAGAGGASLGLVACHSLLRQHGPGLCEGKAEQGSGCEENVDEDDEDFDYRFAKPPVTPADIDLQCSVSVTGGLLSGTRPVADLVTTSTFTLPVERGWPRDVNTPDDVARFMCGVIADRLPRWTAGYCSLDLTGAPQALRGGQGWPSAGSRRPPAALRWRSLPEAAPALLTLRKLDGQEGAAYLLGGLFCAGKPVVIRITCEPIGVRRQRSDGEDEEGLDLRVTTRLEGFPVAGRAWLVGGRWWFKRVRLPLVGRLFDDFHTMLHEQMMLHYVAALVS
uniref:Uncharacterized protein n=1 Tax=Alexandrium catenella TaxID=2925 RepID=A0A7S1L2Q2_ALECA